MTDPITLFLFILLLFGIIYLTIIAIYTYGWFRLKSYLPVGKMPKTLVSIIIPARNEEDNIFNILNDLVSQKYPNKLFEIIVVDDNSTDRTASIINEFIKNNPDHKISLVAISGEKPFMAYKKKAIRLAIEKSLGELIITTDADCSLSKNWLASFVSFYESENARMIVGPVSFNNELTVFQKMQTLEFLSLIAITGGAIKTGRPIMCNGANLAYEKKAFNEVGGFGNDKFSSGDDVFLLLKIRNKFGNKSVRFLKNYHAFVFTEAKKTIRDFFHQRVRWASKNKGYDLRILFVSFSVYMTNLLLIAGLILCAFYNSILEIIILSFIIKTLIELPILIGISNFAKRRKMFLYSFPLIFLYPIYIILSGALGIVGGYQWKGRKLKK